MPKNFIKKYLPDPEKLKQSKALHFLGDVLHDPNLWHLNRRSVIRAFAIGLFWGCIPMPLQMGMAAIFAIKLNANLPLSVATVWFSNPVTMPPIFYFEYLVGAWLLSIPARPFEYELSFAWLAEKLYEIGLPLYIGSVFCGIILALIGYFGVNALWRQNVKARWKKRQETRRKKG
jgi:uncharacterized protein (DUF2062 family)